jgi:two-component system nitrate/nitrite response regulator NarL
MYPALVGEEPLIRGIGEGQERDRHHAEGVTAMGTIPTIIIEPRLLVREALGSLLESHSYRCVCGAGSVADIESSSIAAEGPRLVILGAQSADNAITEAACIRRLAPDSKIVLLFEHISPADFQKLIASQLDGCVPLSVSPHTLISTLDMVMIRGARVMVVGDTRRSSPPLAQIEETHETNMGKSQSDGAKHKALSHAMVTMQRALPLLNDAGASEPDVSNGRAEYAPPSRHFPKLSEREAQILDGLVKGHANKVIARTCDIAEATVKVHMKSILRKIHVGNRTQAAIWALEHGFACDEFKDRAPRFVAASTIVAVPTV